MKVYFKADFCHVKALKEDYIWIFDDFQGKNKAKRWKNTHRLELSTAPKHSLQKELENRTTATPYGSSYHIAR